MTEPEGISAQELVELRHLWRIGQITLNDMAEYVYQKLSNRRNRRKEGRINKK